MFVVAPVRQSAVFDECVWQEFVELWAQLSMEQRASPLQEHTSQPAHACAARAAASATKHRPKDTVNEQENVLFSFSHTHNQRDFLKIKYYSELQNVKKITFLNIFFLMNIIILE